MDKSNSGAAQLSKSEKIYSPQSKEIPKVLGGVKIGLRKLVVVTGASSGLGLSAAVSLAKKGNYYVIMACRDVEKGKKGACDRSVRNTREEQAADVVILKASRSLRQDISSNRFFSHFSCILVGPNQPTALGDSSFIDLVAKERGMPDGSYTVMKLELASLQSVRDFVANLKAFKSARPLTHLICNAAVYKPTDPVPAWTDDGFEMSMGVNHFGHFLLVNLLLDDMSRAAGARVCIVGSITGNTNTVGGGLVYPQADLGDLSGFEKGATRPIAMADAKPFFGAKAYKDSKV
jgi:NAD(P)-dependent dehydrogenase (short-subunit alcohol dehydrogenase family)